MTSPSINSLVAAWQTHFWSADHELVWLDIEPPLRLDLAPHLTLVCQVDAIGRDVEARGFFGEWKTSNGRDRKTWKATWRMNPQSLTNAVLLESFFPNCARFTVRRAYKTDPPTFDFAWYTYSAEELAHWRKEILRIAAEIREYMALYSEGPWPTNWKSCFRYGPDYACPFFEPACSKLDWDGEPMPGVKRVSPLRDAMTTEAGDLILSPSSIDVWLTCRERFRREYMDGCATPMNQAQQDGSEFHAQLADYYRSLVAAV